MLKRNLPRLALGISLAVAAATVSAANYKLTRIDVAGAYSVTAYDVNNRGQVVGNYAMSEGGYGNAYVYEAGVMTTLSGPAGALGASAAGISDGGVVVGAYATGTYTDPDGNTYAGLSKGFIYEAGQYQTVSMPWATETSLTGISGNGRYLSGFGFLDNGGIQSFAVDRLTGVVTLIGSGESDSFSLVGRINDAGVVMGDRRGLNPDGTRWFSAFSFDVTAGQSTDLAGMSGSRRTAFREMNASGMVVGFHGLPNPYDGLVGTPGHYQSFEYGAANTLLMGINDAGWLVGVADNPDYTLYGLLLTPVPVPEPATAALCLGGLALIALRKRRRP